MSKSLFSFNNPWAEMMIEQLWLYRQSTEVAAKCFDAELLTDPHALSDYCLNPTEKRLNPIDFHGKRRSPSARQTSLV